MKQEKGFVLVSVLIITTITTMLAFSQINENRLQERIGGNQQKELNARLAAEKGIIEAFEYITKRNAAGDTNLAIQIALENDSFPNTFPQTGGYNLGSIGLVDSAFSFESEGEYFGAKAYLETKINTIEATGLFDYAVIACDGITVGGSAKIDSYVGGNYDDFVTPGQQGPVKVVNGDVTVGNGSGNGINKGIFGAVTAYSITGNHDLLFAGDPVTGYVGEVDECDPLEIADNMPIYSGTAPSFTAAANSNFDGTSSVGGVSPVDLVVLGETVPKKVYVFDDFVADGIINITGDVTLYIKGDMEASNPEFTLAADSSLTIFIDGKMDISSNTDIFGGKSVSNSSGKIPLTVYSSFGGTASTGSTDTAGTTTETSENTVTQGQRATTTTTEVTTTVTTVTDYFKGDEVDSNVTTTTGLPEATVDTTEVAVALSGNASIYMNVYAPHGNVEYNGTGDIMGALRGKNVDISGTGGIHYDEGIAGLGLTASDGSTSLSNVYYSYR